MLVELKNGETLNGHLVACDTYMNLTLKEVVQTSADGDKFFRVPECYVRGNNVSRTTLYPASSYTPGRAVRQRARNTVLTLRWCTDQVPPRSRQHRR
jgi:U6 snRNA-associated Sm-like protein LSm4